MDELPVLQSRPPLPRDPLLTGCTYMKHIPSPPFCSCLVRNTQGVVDTPDGCAPIQRNHNRLKRAVANLMKFNKGNYTVPHQGRDKPVHQCMLGADWLQSSLVEKPWRSWGQSEWEPAICPGSKGQQHPGRRHWEQHSQQNEGDL